MTTPSEKEELAKAKKIKLDELDEKCRVVEDRLRNGSKRYVKDRLRTKPEAPS